MTISGKDLAPLLGVTPQALSAAAKWGHYCGEHDVSSWAVRSASGVVKGFEVPDYLMKKNAREKRPQSVSRPNSGRASVRTSTVKVKPRINAPAPEIRVNVKAPTVKVEPHINVPAPEVTVNVPAPEVKVNVEAPVVRLDLSPVTDALVRIEEHLTVCENPEPDDDDGLWLLLLGGAGAIILWKLFERSRSVQVPETPTLPPYPKERVSATHAARSADVGQGSVGVIAVR